MNEQISRRDFLKLAGALPISLAVPRYFDSFGIQENWQNVIVIIFDALSAYNVSLYGYQRETMPNLARLAERAIVYHNHYAGGNFTTPGTASLLTGTLPWTHRAFDLYGTVDDSYIERNIFTAFQTYYRLAYTHNPVANVLLEQIRSQMDDYIPLGNLLLTSDDVITNLFHQDESTATISWTRAMKSVDEGYAYSLFFSRILRVLRERNISSLRSQFPGGIPSIAGDNYFLLEDAIDWLGDILQSLQQPFMGYFHFMPPHGPYRTNKNYYKLFDGDGYLPPYKPLSLFARERNVAYEHLLRKRTNYDEFILYVDREFGRFMERMERNGLLENTWVVLTTDHGELFERGIVGHLTNVLYEPVIRIPLLIFEPGRRARSDIYSRTNAIDILPTLLHVTGQKQVSWGEGVVLPPFSPGQEINRSMYVVQSRKNSMDAPIDVATTAHFKDDYKLIYYFGYPELGAEGERIELYDVKNDPDELNDLSSSKRETTAELLNELKQKLSEVNEPYL